MKTSPVRPRAVILGVTLGAFLCLATPYNNLYLGATPLAGGHFPLAPFVLAALLGLLVSAWSRLTGRKSLLRGPELLTVWILCVLMCGIAYTGLARTFFINLTALARFGSEGGRLGPELARLMPHGLAVTDPAAVEALYNGLPGGRDLSWLQALARTPWHSWAAPLAAWGVFVGLCFAVMVCLANLLGRQWVVAERMNFPLLRLPLLMAERLDKGGFASFFTDPYLLAGLFLPVALHTLNGLAFYIPSVPQIPTIIAAGPYFPRNGLLSGYQKLRICFYPAFVGFAFLAARQVSLSFWLFFLLGGLVSGALAWGGWQVPAQALGVAFGPGLAAPEDTQAIGAYGVFFLFIVWLARRHLWEVARQALRFRFGPPRPGEWFSAGLAFWGLVIGGAGLTAWCAWFGMPVVQTGLMLAMFFVVTLVASRIVCQGGVAYFTLAAAPMDGLTALLGSSFFAGTALLAGAVMQKMEFLDLRESLMPSLVHASKVSEQVSTRRLYFVGMVAALVVGAAVSLVAMLVLCHQVGLQGLSAQWETSTVLGVYENARRLVETPTGPNFWVIGFALAGAGVMALVMLAYQRFPWWPLHPLGYLTMYSSSMRILWFSFFLGWLCNQLTLRYGGMPLFVKVRMVFVGLIVGDFLMGGVFAVAGLFLGQSYQVLPG